VKRIVALVVLLGIITTAAAWSWWHYAQKPISETAKESVFVVEPGMTAEDVAAELEQQGIIRSALAFNILARLEKVDASLKAGNYILSPSMSVKEIIALLLEGPKPEHIVVTIPEGYYTSQIIDLLVAKGLGTKEEYEQVLATAEFEYEFLESIPETVDPAKRLDGFLFPDTYFFSPDSTPYDVIDRLLDRFEDEVTEEVKATLAKRNLTLYEWVTLGSIVEKEAAKDEDRPIIAGVFYNRLAKGMPLQSCATIQYILGKPKAVLYDQDLEIESPYNTYKYAGLPPGPISNPGHASLVAALYPAQTKYLYFLAKSDGYHVFAETYEQHLRNQQLYQNPETLAK